jgi:uncharacterized protein
VSRIIYLHGFASGPSSSKARFFQSRFAQLGIGLEIPDLSEGNFERLTISGQLAVIERVVAGDPVSLIGSSMGGYLATLYAARHPEVEKLVLLAPAFAFPTRWPEEFGALKMEKWRTSDALPVFHYSEGRMMMLGYQLVEDGKKYEAYPKSTQPALIFQGIHDTVVPAVYASDWAAQHPEAIVRLLNSDHQLLNVLDDMWIETERFLLGN